MSAPSASDTALRLRESFDRAFTEAPAGPAAACEDLLAIRVGGDPHALRLGELASLHAGARLAPLPARSAELLGLANLRGAVTPVYDLGALLGYAPAPARWLAVARAPQRVAFAFERFERQLRVPLARVLSAESSGGRAFICGAVQVDGSQDDCVRPLIDLGALLAAVRAQCARTQ